jgi:hypothetical protein
LLYTPLSSRLLGDRDEDVQEQAFNVVRNLTESEDGIAMVFKEVGKEVLGCITAGLSSENDNVVLQVFYISSYDYTSFTDTLPRQPLCSPTCRMEHSNNKI